MYDMRSRQKLFTLFKLLAKDVQAATT